VAADIGDRSPAEVVKAEMATFVVAISVESEVRL